MRYRTLVVLGVIWYIALFNWMYVRYLYQEFDYLGFGYDEPGRPYLIAAWVLAFAPSIWMPLWVTRPSQFAYWVLYITVLIPSMFVPLYAGLEPPAEVMWVLLALFMGFVIIGMTYAVPLHVFRRPTITPKTFWACATVLVAVLLVWLIKVYGRNLQFASFSDIYDLRNAADDLSEGSYVTYAFMLMTGAVGPFLMAYGLFCRKSAHFIAGAGAQLLIYSIAGTKGSLLSIAFVPGIYLLLVKTRLPFGLKFLSCCLLLLAGTFLSYIAVGGEPGVVHRIGLFVILCRALSINGLATTQYYDFFLHNPWTYYSHLHVANWFVSYPYKYPVGVELGLQYAGTTDLDATAHFWAMDGLAALGLAGVVLVSFCCAAVFWVLDSIASRHDPRFSALVIAYAAYNLANIGLFTSLLSGGLGLLMVVLYCLPGDKDAVGFRKMSTHFT